ncbi:MAG: hypothetical protein ACKVII_26905 [Planctomycetales bacterium]|jgi:hypothetical protein
MNSSDYKLRNYISAAEKLLLQGLSPHAPQTLDQLDWLVDEHPEHARPYLPPSAVMHHLGQHSQFGRLKPFPELFRERFLRTLLDEPQFGFAIANVLRMEDD